ncbi:transposase [Mangrovicoccus sp. HB161399]|uniref:transposase n=1 Tax=Mangrovicoccus sp. HB161399 TaxID=2720392 RepID=UPI001552BD63|nr:transposase [Mangrovicoccus sp. HB161399]
MKVAAVVLGLAKNVFQVHGVTAECAAAFGKPLRRSQLLAFSGRLEACLAGMEACASSHHWARQLSTLGREARLKSLVGSSPA